MRLFLYILICSLLFTGCGSLFFPEFKIEHLSVADGYIEHSRLGPVRITFSDVPNMKTVRAAFALEENGLPLVGEFSQNGRTAVFTPLNGYRPESAYELRISKAAENTQGVSLNKEVRVQFSTRQSSVRPEVLETFPVNGTIVDDELTAIRIHFSKPVLQSELAFAITLTPSFDYLVQYDDTAYVLEIIPTTVVPVNKMYTVSIDSTLTDLSGNTLPDSYSFVFWYRIDTERPVMSVSVLAPDNTYQELMEGGNLEELGQNIDIMVLFDKPVDLSLLRNRFEIFPSLSFRIEENQESRDRARIVFLERPVWGSTYQITIRNGIQDLSGNKILTDFQASITIDGLMYKQPFIDKSYLNLKNDLLPGNPWYSLSPEDQYADLVFPVEDFPPLNPVETLWVIPVFISSVAAGLDLPSLLDAIRISSLANCVDITIRTITVLEYPDFEDPFFFDADYPPGSYEEQVFFIVVTLEVSNRIDQGMTTFTINKKIRDLNRNELKENWQVVVNKG